jgi:8-amino-7-oxononanoate synthase
MSIDEIKKLIKAGSLRSLKQREKLIDLSSNDYLGLSQDLSFQRAIVTRWEQWSKIVSQRVGSTGSRLLTGNHAFFEETEEKIACFHGFPAATLFNCGYMANLALLSSLFTEKDTLIADLNVHASLHDGMKLSKARKFYFRHNDLQHLEMRLKNKDRCFVVIESIYSMSGQRAALREMIKLCEKHSAHLIVDEAHAIGVLGPQGKGLIAQDNLQERIFACMGAFGKALGVHGAVVLGSKLMKKMFLNFARPLIYTTALPLPLLAAITCSYERFPSMDNERRHIFDLCSRFQFPSHIHPISVKGNSQVKLLSHFLTHRGFDVRPIMSPTVPKGEERLRLTLHSFNESRHVLRCLESINQWQGS